MKKLLYTFIFSFLVLMGSNLNAQVQNNLDKGMRYIEQNAKKWGLQETDYVNSLVSDMYTNTKTGITYIYLIQAHNGIPIHNAITPLAVDVNGEVRVVRHGYLSNVKERISSSKPKLEPIAAIKSAASHLGIVATEMPTLLRSNKEENTYEFSKPNFALNELKVKLMYVKDGESLKLAWNLAIDEVDNPDYYNTFVDANTGEVITKYNYTVKCQIHKDRYSKHIGCNHDRDHNLKIANFKEASVVASSSAMTGGTYNVFALPVESPIYGDRTTLVAPYFVDASPFGWHDVDGVEGAEYTITRGNNVHAYLDKQNTDASSNDEPDGGADLIFDLEYDIANEADVNEDAATVNLFYTVNMFHDILSRLGFDEQAGNFQQVNYGPGGQGGDYILAQASDGFELPTPTLDNANFSTPPDGGNGRMQMYLWGNPSGILSIDEPEVLAGFVGDIIEARDPQTGLITWGGTIPNENETPVTGKVVIAVEDSPGNPINGCNPILNADEVAGNIALVDRGLCDFSLKAYNAQEAGAISVIICNVEGGSALGGMGGGDNADLVSIIPLLLPKDDCDRIKASILSDIDVTITLQNRGPVGPSFLDGSVDNGIVVHEFGHGVSNRLIGGPNIADCLSNGEQAGEGISDFFTLAMTVEEGDAGSDPRGIGNYADAQSVNGVGIRTFPYSTDMSINPTVYDDIKTRGEGLQHSRGEIWTIALWEVYWSLVDQFGLDTKWEDEESGNYKAVRLAIEGMKLTPCSPSLIDLRDGVLAADSLLYNGENGKLLWIAFAKRGLGYLADDGGNSNDVTDGTQNFDPFPLVIETLKIRASSTNEVKPGEEVTVQLDVVNHNPELQTNVLVAVNIPDGLTYVDGSASMDATFDNGELKFEIGDMAYLDELTITYDVLASNSVETQTLFYDNVDEADQGAYDFGATEGFNLWFQSFDVANSESASWWASQPDTEVETDFFMTIPPLEVVGERPVLKFANRFDVETGADGGFLQLSTDGEVFFDVKDKFIRNGYTSSIQYTTFAIPLLEAFSGTTNEEWIYSYLDLSEYKGQTVYVKFRFGTDDNTGVLASAPGWFVDDLELVDLVTYPSVACISSDNSTSDQCTNIEELFVDSDQIIDTKVEELEGFNISIAPNPASDYVSIGISTETNTPIQLSLTSIDGRVVQSMNMVVGTNQSVRTFNTSELEKGMYLIQIKSENGLTTKKIVIQ